jgi:NAD(P)H-flavin reductase
MSAQAEIAPGLGPMVPVPFRVRRRRRETSDTWTLTLEPLRGDGIAPAPGQFTMVYSFGIGEIAISVSGTDAELLTHTVRAVGATSAAICNSRPGAVLGVRGPFGNSWPLEQARGADVVVVAGGVGLAPLRTSVQRLERGRKSYGEVSVLYGGRTPGDLLYQRELAALERRGKVNLAVTVDAAARGWQGNVGVVPKLVADARFDPGSAIALVCGPEIMMRFTAEALIERGMAPERIYISMERNMHCGVGHCGHCQLGPTLICRDGPVYSYDVISPLMEVREL